ncbi:Outer membrane protein beta-barrel domain-containing protein [Mariniphaga anaerophila]|uniref:Outer membrane protein beta-barrel domain-containing protein n=1 Tax=Mariniphaga anaerophila TaxID=1484053 RepID=A0A1M4VFU7_9BACT|nr:outer membrane beta-barrel protein [Mariniphaga anaerophila]SHE67798.1 Outer membrane protein beta-barrel domain-containing protein [Mariniphaga anaerophila]
MDKIFREKLDDFSKEPPAFLWENIQAELAGQRRKKRMAWYRWSAAAVLLALAFVSGWYFSENAEEVAPRVVKSETVKTEDEPEKVRTEAPAQLLPDVAAETDSRKKMPLLADATGKKTVRQKELAGSDKAETEERILPAASADFSEIEHIASVNVRVSDEEQNDELVQNEGQEIVPEFVSWERTLIAENARVHNNTTKSDDRGWKLGLNVSPGYSSYSVSHGSGYARNMTYQSDDGNASVGGGISVQYKTGKRISVESGVYYAQNGQRTGSTPGLFSQSAQADYAAAPPDRTYFNTALKMTGDNLFMNSTAGIIEFKNMPKGANISANLESAGDSPNSLLTRGDLSQVFDFVEIPLYLRYLVVDQKIDLELVGGINAGLVVGNSAYLKNEYGVQDIGRTRDISKVNVSGTLGVGVNYALGKHLSVAVEPRINYYLNSINRNPEVDFRPYRVGVYTGLYYAF